MVGVVEGGCGGRFPALHFPPVLPEIVDGNAKMTLGMIWTIILRFAIQDISVEGMCTRAHVCVCV